MSTFTAEDLSKPCTKCGRPLAMHDDFPDDLSKTGYTDRPCPQTPVKDPDTVVVSRAALKELMDYVADELFDDVGYTDLRIALNRAHDALSGEAP